MQYAAGINAGDTPSADYSAATIVPAGGATVALSDEECIQRLADVLESEVLESNDADKLEVIATLIGRLAVTIE